MSETDRKSLYEAPRVVTLDQAMTARAPLDHRQGPAIESLAGHDPLALIERYGSPLMIFDHDRLKAVYEHFLGAFTKRWPKTRVAYSVKTNHLSAIVAS